MLKPDQTFTESAPAAIFGERRSQHRFAVDLALDYEVVNRGPAGQTGTGRVLNMSASGIAFATHDKLDLGWFLDVVIPWPVLSEDMCPTTLLVYGRVVRNEHGYVALEVVRQEFQRETAAA